MADKQRYSFAKAFAGRGTRERNQRRDAQTDAMVTGDRQSSTAPTASESENAHSRSVYTPSTAERSARVYGTPMAEPLVGKPKHERKER